MSGICLISGINYSGKDTVRQMITATLNEQGFPVRSIPSASALMIRIGNLAGHHELSQLPIEARNSLRLEMLRKLSALARDENLLFDVHFSFENGETPDLTPLSDSVVQILHLDVPPEVILERARRDPKIGSHPGRLAIFQGGVQFIREYSRHELEHARRFHDSLMTSHPAVRFSSIPNTTLAELQAELRPFLDILKLQYENSPRSTIEGSRYDYGRRR